MKRIFLFLATNMAVLLAVRLLLGLFGANPQDLSGLLILSAVAGFAGSLISLLMSKSTAKHAVGAHVIREPRSETEHWLLNVVQAQARQWNLQTPEVAIYDAPEPNAFATGASRNNSLVAVSTGLLRSMTRDEVEAVLAHEMAHVGNGDMVTLTLIQGVVNTFVLFFSRLIAGAVASSLRQNQNSSGSQGVYLLVSMVFQVIFGWIAGIIVMWFSRQREYRADAGAAKLVGAPKMIAALQRLKGSTGGLPQDMSAMGINDNALRSLFSTHPTLDDRIARLQQLPY
ncbi:protease HtpX [Eikenella sp. S3360]|uniref:Protease HtpX homolog n=1 Tax=Eikenella glucosivorans TaxID=2766967 RepID=A0ABS0NB70_9NEIS|nr:protease HtpX [Eikenella glucosivorans]